MRMCSGFGRRRGECTEEATYLGPEGEKTLCHSCQVEYERTVRAADQASQQRQYDVQQGLVTVWE